VNRQGFSKILKAGMLAASNDFLWWCVWTQSTRTTTKIHSGPQGMREGKRRLFNRPARFPMGLDTFTGLDYNKRAPQRRSMSKEP